MKKQYTKPSAVPNTLAEIRKKIREFKSKGRSNRVSVYKQMNKEYKTFDWKQKYFLSKDVKHHIEDGYFKGYRRLVMDGQLKLTKFSNMNYGIERENLQALCLLKQLCAQMDNKYFFKYKKPKKKKIKFKKYYFDSAYRGRLFICYYPQYYEWKIQEVTKYLKTKQYLFDKDNQFYKTLKPLRYFIQKSLLGSKMQKWDTNLQKFLSKND